MNPALLDLVGVRSCQQLRGAAVVVGRLEEDGGGDEVAAELAAHEDGEEGPVETTEGGVEGRLPPVVRHLLSRQGGHVDLQRGPERAAEHPHHQGARDQGQPVGEVVAENEDAVTYPGGHDGGLDPRVVDDGGRDEAAAEDGAVGTGQGRHAQPAPLVQAALQVLDRLQ